MCHRTLCLVFKNASRATKLHEYSVARLGRGALIKRLRAFRGASYPRRSLLVKESDRMQAKAALGGIGVTENDVAKSPPLLQW